MIFGEKWWPSLFAFFLSAVSLIRDQRKYTKIRNSRTFPCLFAIFDSIWYQIWLLKGILGPYSAPSLFAVSEFAVFWQNVSTANLPFIEEFGRKNDVQWFLSGIQGSLVIRGFSIRKLMCCKYDSYFYGCGLSLLADCRNTVWYVVALTYSSVLMYSLLLIMPNISIYRGFFLLLLYYKYNIFFSD